MTDEDHAEERLRYRQGGARVTMRVLTEDDASPCCLAPLRLCKACGDDTPAHFECAICSALAGLASTEVVAVLDVAVEDPGSIADDEAWHQVGRDQWGSDWKCSDESCRICRG